MAAGGGGKKNDKEAQGPNKDGSAGTGGKKGGKTGGNGGIGGGPKQGPNRDGSTVDANPSGKSGAGAKQGPNRDGSTVDQNPSGKPGLGGGPKQGPNKDGSTVGENPSGKVKSVAPDDEGGFLDSLFDPAKRRQAYKNNPNRPNYDTTDMGVPVDMTFEDAMLGNNLVGDPVFNGGLNAIGAVAPGIGPGLAATRAIQAATGMSGGPSVGGYGDGKLGGEKNTRDGKDGRDNSLAAAILGAQKNPEPEDETSTSANASTADPFVEGEIDPETGLKKKKIKSQGLPFSYNSAVNTLMKL